MELTVDYILQSHSEKPERLLGLEASKLSITRVSSLLGLTRLKSINLSSNLIESLEGSGIDRLKDLKEIDVSCNSLKSLRGAINPAIVKLNFSFNRIEALEGLGKVRFIKFLQILRCEGNLVESLKPLAGLNALKMLDLSSNNVQSLQGIESIQVISRQLEELYLNHNRVLEIRANELPATLRILHLRGNQISSVAFLARTPALESLNLDQNRLEMLSELPSLQSLTELILSRNQIFVLGLSSEIHTLLPSLQLLDLSFNSLYDRFELLTLNKIPSLFELSLEGNPFCGANFREIALKDYPNVLILNNAYIRKTELESRPASRTKSVYFDEARARKEVKDLSDAVISKRKACLTSVKEIDYLMERQFYDEFKLLKNSEYQREEMFVVNEEHEDEEHEDLHEQEQEWFNTQMQWTRKVIERKGATHRYYKDERPSSSQQSSEKTVASTAKGANRHRKKLEDAINFTARKK